MRNSRPSTHKLYKRENSVNLGLTKKSQSGEHYFLNYSYRCEYIFQETLSWYGSSSVLDPPLIRVQHVPTRSTSLEDVKITETQSITKSLSAQPPITSTSKRPKSVKKSNNIVCFCYNVYALSYIIFYQEELDKNVKKDKEGVEEEDVDDEEFIKRRGKKRRKRGRDASRGPPAFQPSLDPETQVK